MANRKLKCCGCKDRFNAETMLRLPGGNFHSMECATEYGQAKGRRAIDRQKAKAKKAEQNKRKANKQAVRDLGRQTLRWQHKHTQKAFNRMRVLQELLWFKEKGMEPECISCGRPLGGDQWCCGHFKTVGAHPELRYDPQNTKLQHNRNCNMGLSGDIYGTKNTHGYVEGLKIRFGREEGQQIIDYCERQHPSVNWSWQELEEMRKDFNEEIRRLEGLL